MRTLTIAEFVSLDGVMQAPGHSTEDPAGFEHGGWTQPFFTDHGRYLTEALATTDALLLGRRTYEIFAGYWPTVIDPHDPIAAGLNERPKYVASTTMTVGTWKHTTILEGDLATAVSALKTQPRRGILVIGSSTVCHQLFAHDLVDEYQLWFHPVVLGGGKRLFAEGGPMRTMVLIDARVTTSGLALLTYRPDRREPARSRPSLDEET